ncbi:LysR substrate-binding domain-containing protein [Alcaligenes faecalis]|uniref:LysR family transcriptional regulator n=1 Tax=Alcaligenes TaxID=507 RepID=UPI002AA33B23|nr:LysR family transcriptional regulator [Alcaligenes phenolicus]
MSTSNLTSLMSDMVVFVKVVETGSFSEASRQLGYTPSAVSRSIARLEKGLGTRVLQRTTRKLRLSDSGQAIYEHARDMLSCAQAAMEISGQFQTEPEGKIRLSVPKAVGHFLIHPHMPDFLAAHPKVNVLMNLDDRYADLIDDQLDLAIRITDQPPPGLMGRHLTDIRHGLYASPEYLAEHSLPIHPQQLREHSCIYLGEAPSDSRWRFNKGGRVLNVSVSGRYAANHTGVRLDAVERGLGIGSLPCFVAKEPEQEGRIVRVLADWEFRTQYCGALWALYPPTRHLPPKLRLFVEFLAGRLGGGRTDVLRVPF